MNAAFEEAWGKLVPSFAMASYDAVHVVADAMERAGSYTDAAAIVAAIEATDIELSQGRYHFAYGSHNPDLPEGTPAWMWHQWPDPIVTVMQYYEAESERFECRCHLSGSLSDAWHVLYRAGDIALSAG